jgi:hypothetical protein
MIEVVRIHLAALWVSLMLIFLLGDVVRIFVGDFTPGAINGTKITQAMALGIAVLMLIPILMVFLSLVLPYPTVRWVTIIVAIFFFLFNLMGLPTYPGNYDKFLLFVSLVFNALTVWYAWNWV